MSGSPSPASGPAPAIEPLGSGRYRLRDEQRVRLAYAVAAGTDTWVWLDGHVYVVPAGGASGHRRTSRADDEALLTAPMPATVVAVHVQPGQQVTRGEVLIRLEAMKMELSIMAPRDGRVTRVACRAGELVQQGVMLLDMDEP